MDTVKLKNKGGTEIIAHRGLSGIEKENTIAAFVAAGNRSYFGIETDVHITADGKFIIIHDDTTGRVAEIDVFVENTPYDELREINLTDTDGLCCRIDLRMPNLAEYIKICKRYNKTAVLELKNPMEKVHLEGICKTVAESDYLKNTVFISFNYNNLLYIKNKYPNQAVQLLCFKADSDLTDRLKKDKMDLDIYFESVTKRLLDDCRSKGIKVNCWTVNNPEEAKRLIELGVNFITTNILE